MKIFENTEFLDPDDYSGYKKFMEIHGFPPDWREIEDERAYDPTDWDRHVEEVTKRFAGESPAARNADG